MKNFRPALESLEEIEALFVPRLRLSGDRILQFPATPLCEIKLLA
jgi:hypothetical protein